MTSHHPIETVTSAVGPADVPPAVLACDTFTGPDYVDCFTIATSSAAAWSPEQWARAALEETPTGRSAPTLWRSLGLRLGPRPSPEHIQGWAIAGRGADWIRIETASWYMTANAVARVDDGQVSLALFLRYDHPLAPIIWAPVGILHRRGVPGMLRQAVAIADPGPSRATAGPAEGGPAEPHGPCMAKNAVVRARR